MATFMESCRCKGTRPQGIVGHTFSSRPDLVGKMLHDRRVARFLVAPPGYGKSTVAFEYADIVFGFKRVFWIRCASPCFLRDLDAGALISSLIGSDPDAALVVCDDVPLLDDERAEAFNGFVDAVLARGCEVVITCAPAADTFSVLQRDRMLINATDLLLTDDELSLAATAGALDASEIRDRSRSERAACLVWHGDGMRLLIEGASSGEMPLDVALAVVVLLLLGRGGFDDLTAVLSADRASEAWEYLADDYPYLGIDRRTGTYVAMRCSVARIASGFSQRLDDLATCSIHADRGSLVGCVADMLLQREGATRAAEVMAHLAPKQAACAWLVRSCRRLVACAEPVAISDLHESVRRRSTGFTDQLSLCKCWSALLLDDRKSLEDFAKRVVRSGSADTAQKLEALSFLVARGEGDLRARAHAKLMQLAERTEGGKAERSRSGSLRGDAAVLAAICLAAGEGAGAGMNEWMRVCAEQQDQPTTMREALLLGAAWLFEAALAECDVVGSAGRAGEEGKELQDALMQLARYCAREGERIQEGASLDWFGFNALRWLDAASERWMVLQSCRAGEEAHAQMRRMEVHLSEQRERYQAAAHAVSPPVRRSSTSSHSRPNRSAEERATPAAVPLLSVNLFGGMEVRIGGDLVEPRFLRRMKVKTLLALLVMNRGREIQRDNLASMLWPHSATNAYRNNFYSVWSQLKRSLQVGGSCPYLIRTQTGCSLDPRLVTSDVHEYEAICRSLLFGTDAPGDWERLYSLVSNEYAGKLMPCEQENETILSLREHYHAQLIDGLIATTNRLIGMSEPRGAVWFAREALRREGRREDVYIALMEAQIAADQRSAALETYFECRQFLNEDLGIDPSLRLVELYRSIIETEDALF
ncbi:AfsR/SARP family transcriptional regulator [Adlercreutzia murintestinalis]|uniref:AfsR/SARP family transcriptional regulator n=1 Tax=Adlercreutzia murintestinalis TaxID=2941325 RepID=UPI00203EB3EB|nr:BTAD domain-containing putative transcriptional regulator [Adlercreutzia murintestinalis]